MPDTETKSGGGRRGDGSRRRTLKAFGLLICTLVVFATVFALLVYREMGATRQHQLRVLDRAAHDAEARVALTLGNVRNLRGEVTDADKVAEFSLRQPYLQLRRAGAEGGGTPRLECDEADVDLSTATQPPSISLLGCGADGVGVRFDFDVGGLMASVLPEHGFEGFLLFDAEGRRLARVTSDQGPMMRTAAQLSGEGLADALGVAQLPVLRTVSHRVRVAGQWVELSCQPLVVPRRLHFDGSAREHSTWTLCGASTRSRRIQEAITLSPGWTMTFALLGLLGLAVMPYVKPVFMARRERLTRTDLVFLAVGTLLLLHILALVGFGVYRVLALRAGDVAHLENLADRVEESLVADLRAVYGSLGRLDRVRCDALSDDGAGARFVNDEGLEDGVPRETLLFRRSGEPAGESAEDTAGDTAGDTDADAGPLRLAGILEDDDPLFLSVFWLDDQGDQIHKLTARDQNTPVVNVAHREYFRHIRDGAGWPARPVMTSGPAPAGRVFVDTAFSITTSQPFFALSIPSACATHESLRVAVLTGVLPTMTPSVSPAFGFVVVRSDGGVVLSSLDGLYPDDDFFALLDDPREMRSALASGAEQVLTADFGRASHRVRIRPSLPCLGGDCSAEAGRADERWWIVTFYDRELTTTLFGEVLTLALGLSLLACFAFGLLAYTLRRHLRAMIWPRRDHLPIYLRILVLLAVYLLLWLVWYRELVAWWSHLDLGLGFLGTGLLALLLVVVPLLLVRLGFLHGVIGSRSRFGDWLAARGVDRPDRWAYRVMLFLFWLSLSVVPAGVFFQSAWEFDTLSLSRQEARWWQEEFAERLQRIETEWHELADPSYVEAREATWSDRFPIFPFLEVCAGDEECRRLRAATLRDDRGHVLEPLARLLPAYNATSVRLRHQWTGRIPGVEPWLELRDAHVPADRLRPGRAARWILLFVLLGLMAVIWVWIRFVSRHFALRFFRRPDTGPPLVDLVDETSHAAGDGPIGRRIVILTSNQHWATVRRDKSFDFVDLATPDDADLAAAEGTGTVAVTGLARALADSDLRASALRRVGDLVDSRRPILVFTGSDPWPILAAAAAGHGAGEGAGIADFGDARRWAGMLGEFRIEYAKIDWEAMGEPRCQGDHWAIWWRCSDAEKLALLQLAEEGFLNPKQSTELDQLVRRNLLTLEDPSRPISYVDTAFCRFVQGAAASEHLLAWERTLSDQEGWHGLRYAFGIFFVALFGFLFLVDQSLFDNVQTLLAALAALVPLSFGIIRHLQKPAE